MQETSTGIDPDLESCSSGEPHLITYSELHGLVTDLGLSRAKVKLLVSRLQEWCLLSPAPHPRTRLFFGAASATVQLPIDCYDVSVTDDGRLLLAARLDGLIEYCANSGQELSRWRPPRSHAGRDEWVQAVEALSDGRVAVGLWYKRTVVLLRRATGTAAGEEAWTEDRRLEQLQRSPRSLSAHGDLLAAAVLSSCQLELVSLGGGQRLGSMARDYWVQSVAVTEELIITVSSDVSVSGRREVNLSSDRRTYMVDAHSRGDDRRVWRYELPEGEVARDVCADAAGRVLYVTVRMDDWSSGRVTAISAVDGSELQRDVISCDGRLLPYKLSLSRLAEKNVLVVLCYKTTEHWYKTVTVHSCVSS